MVADGGFEIVGGVFQACGIDEEVAVVDARDDVVAGGSLFAGDDGGVCSGEAIEEGGFAGVGLADDGDDGEV